MSNHSFSPMQLSLLARGAVRLDGAIFPIAVDAPETVDLMLAAEQLAQKTLVAWITVADPTLSWKHECRERIGLVITDQGRAVLEAIETEVIDQGPAQSKISQVIDMLRSTDGVGVVDIAAATGWQPHSVRSALTLLRKRGFLLQRIPIEGAGPRYRQVGEGER